MPRDQRNRIAGREAVLRAERLGQLRRPERELAEALVDPVSDADGGCGGRHLSTAVQEAGQIAHVGRLLRPSDLAWFQSGVVQYNRALILYSLGAALRKQRFRDRTGFLAHHPGPAVFLRLSKPELSPHFEV